MGITDPVGASMALVANDALRAMVLQRAIVGTQAAQAPAPKPQPSYRIQGIGEQVDVRL